MYVSSRRFYIDVHDIWRNFLTFFFWLKSIVVCLYWFFLLGCTSRAWRPTRVSPWHIRCCSHPVSHANIVSDMEYLFLLGTLESLNCKQWRLYLEITQVSWCWSWRSPQCTCCQSSQQFTNWGRCQEIYLRAGCKCKHFTIHCFLLKNKELNI